MVPLPSETSPIASDCPFQVQELYLLETQRMRRSQPAEELPQKFISKKLEAVTGRKLVKE
jgi:hypothetical protein